MSPSRGESTVSPGSKSIMTRLLPFSRERGSKNDCSHPRKRQWDATAHVRGTDKVPDVSRHMPNPESRATSMSNPLNGTWTAADATFDASFLDAILYQDVASQTELRAENTQAGRPSAWGWTSNMAHRTSTSSKRKSGEISSTSNKICRLQHSSSPRESSRLEQCLGDPLELEKATDYFSSTVETPSLLNLTSDGDQSTLDASGSLYTDFDEFSSTRTTDLPSLSSILEHVGGHESLHLDGSCPEFSLEQQRPESFLYMSDAISSGPWLLEPPECPTRHDSVLSTTRSPTPAKESRLARKPSSLTCATCGICLPTETQLEAHAISQDHRAFRCDEPGCNHTTQRQDLLLRHKNYHKAPKEYECKHCDEYRGSDAFKRLDALDQHMKRMHPKEFEKQLIKHCPYPDCEYAKSGFRFVNRVEYRGHMANVHGEGKTCCPVEGCKRTGKDGFKRLTDLQKHVEKQHPLEMLESPNPLQKAGLV